MKSRPATDASLAARTAQPADAAAITAIYNQGIEDRVGTFETERRQAADIEAWFPHAKAFVAVEDPDGEVVGYAVAHPYAGRPCYAGIGAFSVYVRRDQRGRGVGRVAMTALVDAAREAGLWKLTSRVFPENRASLALMAWSGFKEVGVYEKHGKLDGVWRDCVIVERLLPENLD
ncbi:arsinothricin resistance N-acetyltransferase ArsN1 family A [Phenylobacterium sp.]|uniref:arsinothricin resistance N-acetyltransferase ArsN1 family A n=1 Tax=Phenylobacterium sp. TaxID=1871053 RepID=UPI002ED810F0